MVVESFVLLAQQLIAQFAYLGVFLLSIIGTSTIFIPLPLDIMMSFAAGAGLNPFSVGIVVGLGAAIGELVGYLVGLGGRHMLEEKERRLPKVVKTLTKLFERYGFWLIVTVSFLPIGVFDIVGILSGISNYDIKKFYVGVAIGKIGKALLFAYLGSKIVPFIAQWVL